MVIKKYIPISAGLSFRQNELTRRENMASEMTNADYSEHKSLTKRVGLHPIKWGHVYETFCEEAFNDNKLLNAGVRQIPGLIKNILEGRGCWLDDTDITIEGDVKSLSEAQQGVLERKVGKWTALIPSDGTSAFVVALRGLDSARGARTFYRTISLDGEQPVPFDDRGPLGNTARQRIIPTAHRAFRGITYLSTADRVIHRTDKKDILPVGIEGYEREGTTKKTFSVYRDVTYRANELWTGTPATLGVPGPGGFDADEDEDGPNGWAIQGGRAGGELRQFSAPAWDKLQKAFRAFDKDAPIQTQGRISTRPTLYFFVSINRNTTAPLESLLEVDGEPVDNYIRVGQVSANPLAGDSIIENTIIGLTSYTDRNGIYLNEGTTSDRATIAGRNRAREAPTPDTQPIGLGVSNLATIDYRRGQWDTYIVKAVPNGIGEYIYQLLKSNIARGRDQFPNYTLSSIISDSNTSVRGPNATYSINIFYDGISMNKESQGQLDIGLQNKAITAKKADLNLGDSDLFYLSTRHNPGVWRNADNTIIDRGKEVESNGNTRYENTFGGIPMNEYLWDLGNTQTPIEVADDAFVQIWEQLKEKFDLDGMLSSLSSVDDFGSRNDAVVAWDAIVNSQGFHSLTLGNKEPTDKIEITDNSDVTYTFKNNFRAEEGPVQTARASRLHVRSGDTTHLAFRMKYTDASLRKNISYSLPYEESFRHYFGTNSDANNGYEGAYPGGKTASITLNEIEFSNTEWAKDFLAPILVRLRNEVEADLVAEGYDYTPGSEGVDAKTKELYEERKRRLLEKLKDQIAIEVYQSLPNDQVHFFVGEFLPKLDLEAFLTTNISTPANRDNQYGQLFGKDPLREPPTAVIPMLGIEATSEELSKGRDALVAGGDFDYVTALKAVVPPKAGIIEEWRNLLVLSDIEDQPNAIRIMDGDNLDGYPISKELVIDNGQALPISAIKELNGVLYVFSRATIHVVSGTPWREPLVSAAGAAIRVDKVLEEGIGAVSQTAITEKDKMLWFVGETSIYTLGREGVQDRAEDLEPLIRTLDKSDVHAFTWKAGERILFNFANDNKTLVYHITVGQWTIWEDVNFDGGVIEKDNKLFVLDKESGQIRTFADLGTEEAHIDRFKVIGVKSDAKAVTTTVLGVPNTEVTDTYAVSLLDETKKDVKFTYKMHWEHLDTPTALKKLNRLKVYALPSLGDEFNKGFELKLTIEYDFGNKRLRSQPLSRNIRMAVDDHPAGWGKSAWGGDKTPDDKTDPLDPADEWGGPSHELLVEKTVRLPSRKCRAFRLTLENDSDENVLITGMEVSGTQISEQVLKRGK